MNILAKLFNKPEEIKNSTITIEVPKTEQEVFDEAVLEVIKAKQRDALYKNLVIYVHGEEKCAQLDAFDAEYPEGCSKDLLEKIKEDYPLLEVKAYEWEEELCVRRLSTSLHDVLRKAVELHHEG